LEVLLTESTKVGFANQLELFLCLGYIKVGTTVNNILKFYYY